MLDYKSIMEKLRCRSFSLSLRGFIVKIKIKFDAQGCKFQNYEAGLIEQLLESKIVKLLDLIDHSIMFFNYMFYSSTNIYDFSLVNLVSQ